jgi:hypothetical protein
MCEDMAKSVILCAGRSFARGTNMDAENEDLKSVVLP